VPDERPVRVIAAEVIALGPSVDALYVREVAPYGSLEVFGNREIGRPQKARRVIRVLLGEEIRSLLEEIVWTVAFAEQLRSFAEDHDAIGLVQ
jgi:hypothetical protein